MSNDPVPTNRNPLSFDFRSTEVELGVDVGARPSRSLANGLRMPGFFIVGAPRCGTTSLCRYLARHPEICFSQPKETHFFSQERLNIVDVDLKSEYLDRFFFHYDENIHNTIGEGSVSYLYSPSALINVLDSNPAAKFIVMVRNPVEMIYSYHSRLLITMDETIEDFSLAWALQGERAAGRHVPATCRDPRLLQYRFIGLLGLHVRQLFAIVGRQRCKVIVFDDFNNNPRRTYRSVLKFIELEDDGRKHFPKKRANRKLRSALIQQMLGRVPKSVLTLVRPARAAIGGRNVGRSLRRLRRRIGTIKTARAQLGDGTRQILADAFAEDIALLSQLLDRDLTHWVNGPGS